MNEAHLEQKIQDHGLNAPRATPGDLDAAIDSVDYVKHVTPSGSVLRWAVLNLKNGFSVAGKPSTAVSAANDKEEIGRQVAYDNVRNELCAFLGLPPQRATAPRYPHPYCRVSDCEGQRPRE